MRPDLRQLKIQAKELLRAVRAADPAALERVLPYFRSAPEFTLVSAQLVLAREHGYESWALLQHRLAPSEERGPSLSTQFFGHLDRKEEEEAVEMLTTHPELAGASRRTEYGWATPLHVCADKTLFQVARALIDAGAEIYSVNQGDYPPVFSAFYARNQEMVDLLLDASTARDNGIPPTYGCGIDLVLATRLGMLDRVQMHVDRDPLAVYRRGCIGESALHWPAHNGHVEIVRLLLDSGTPIEVDEVGLYGGKPLHWASEHAPACVALLLERGANPNSRNLMRGEFEGFTPLHMMASQPNECVENADLLLAAGADPTLRDAAGKLAVDVARERSRVKVVAFLSGV